MISLTQPTGECIHFGLSTDIKPLNDPIGYTFIERDTGKFWLKTATGWRQITSSFVTFASVLNTNFTTSSATAVDVTGLGFVPAPNASYTFSATLMLRTANAVTNPRIGLAWPTGCVDGVAHILQSQSVATPQQIFGNIAAPILTGIGALPNNTQSWPAYIKGMFNTGPTPGGSFRIQLASESAGTNVMVMQRSFLSYSWIPQTN